MRTIELIHGRPFPSLAGCAVNTLNAAHTAHELDNDSAGMLHSLMLILEMRNGK